MMKTRTKLILPLMLLCIAVFALALTASAETKTGTCGDNLTYTLDTDTGTLTISGTGAMTNWNYSSRAPWYADCSSIRTVVIADGVTSIGDDAFYNCRSLESITIPNGVTSIGYDAFYNCRSLTSITIPNSVTSIGDYAFENCDELISIIIPKSVLNIGNRAFDWCASLTGIHVDANNQNYTSVNGVLFNKDKTTLIQAPISLLDAAYAVPDGVTRIDEFAFNDCRGIKSITIPASVAEIGDWAFANTEIENVYISDLAAWCAIDFQGKYTNPVQYNYVRTETTALYLNDTQLTQIEIPADITKISSMALSGFSSITQITVSPDNPNYTSVDGALLSKDKTVLLTVPAGMTGNYTAPAGVATVADTAFHRAALTDVSLPSGVTSIGDHAFDKSEIIHITLPEGLLSIGEYAFFGCDKLESITLPDSLTDIGQSAFCSCRSLESITIPAHVKGLYNQAFEYCDKLTSITILNPDCEIEYEYTIPAAATIYGYSDSTAEAYAKKYDRTFVALDKPAKEYKQGDILTYGSYPQTKVTDSALIAKLNAQSGSWVSYGYYISSSKSDFMQYKDVTLDGAKYRAVKFSSYRPYRTDYSSSASNSFQDDNGYYVNTVYWFKYEPVKWRVLDATDGENLLVISESILDSRAFRNTYYSSNGNYYTDSTCTYYANNYPQSDIRAWLNGDFYNTTFSADEKSHIYTTTITNEAHPGYSQYDAASTQDKVFLLSYKEATNSNYFSNDAARAAQGSDYAKAQGLYVYTSSGGYAGNSWWRLRSAGYYSSYACNVNYGGGVSGYLVYFVYYGARVAFRFNPISFNPIEECDHTWTVTATQPANCTTPGSKTLKCTKCGETKTETIPVNNDHDYSTTWTTDTAATCGAPGSKSHHCTRCGAKTDITVLPATGAHTYVDGVCKDCGAAQPAQSEYKQGDILTFGSYPQTRVTDSALIVKLNAQSGSWISYGYYISSSKSNFMQYKDVTLDGAKYRAVKFSSYRPNYTGNSSSASNSYQDDNGYYVNTIYWFKYEPVKWRVLDATDGENLLVISESILDSRAFRNTYYSSNGNYYTDAACTYYANNYAQSDIRAWLNEDFYNTTFSADEKSHIRTTTITNEAYSASYSKFDAPPTQDKIFLLSCKEATNLAYFKNSDARSARGSDYAKAQGLYVSSSGHAGNSWWRLRSAGGISYNTCGVSYGGDAYSYYYGYSNVIDTDGGTRPALRLNPSCDHTWEVTATQPANCTTPGSKTSACTKCNETLVTYLPPLGHSYQSEVTREATCTVDGIMTYTCTRCGDSYTTVLHTEHEFAHTMTPPTCTVPGADIYTCTKCGLVQKTEIPASHDYVATVTKKPTETDPGTMTYTCMRCGDSYTEEIPPRKQVGVLLLQDRLPWSGDNATALLRSLYEKEYISGWDAATTATVGTLDLSQYGVVYIANDQTTATYDKLGALATQLENYVRAGGVVVYGACDHGWADGNISYKLPGGVQKSNFYSMRNYILDTDHPVVTGALTDNRALTNELLLGTYCSHTAFDVSTLPSGYNAILEDANGNPTLVEYPLGDGYVLLSGLTWEFYYTRIYQGDTTYSKCVYDDLLVYAAQLSNNELCSHRYNDGVVVPPTCTEAGYTLHTCIDCGAAFKDSFVPAKGHTLGAWTVDREATCSEQGERHQTCTACGTTVTEVIPKTAHTEGEWVIDKPASCIATGERSKSCTACGTVCRRETIPAMGHDLPSMPTEAEIPATCKAPGKTAVYRCQHDGCDYYEGGEVIPQKLYGDVNGDGEVSKADLLRLQKYLAGWDVEYDFEPSDLNLDGIITKADLLRLQKYLAGWNVAPWYAER